MTEYPLASQPFETRQGEGHLEGVPMLFIRLAGCPVACPQCDTDYSAKHRLSMDSLAEAIAASPSQWVWVTGGEPLVYDLDPLIRFARPDGRRIGVATSGSIPWRGRLRPDWRSVSPHGDPLVLTGRGDTPMAAEGKLVIGLNGYYPTVEDALDLEEWFRFRFLQPLD